MHANTHVPRRCNTHPHPPTPHDRTSPTPHRPHPSVDIRTSRRATPLVPNTARRPASPPHLIPTSCASAHPQSHNQAHTLPRQIASRRFKLRMNSFSRLAPLKLAHAPSLTRQPCLKYLRTEIHPTPSTPSPPPYRQGCSPVPSLYPSRPSLLASMGRHLSMTSLN